VEGGAVGEAKGALPGHRIIGLIYEPKNIR
jgi:hypothetical protein